MSLEIEAKLKVDSHEPVRNRLAAMGAAYVGRVLESNHIFDTADGQLLAGDRGLRVRTCQVEDGPAIKATFTYKGPREDMALKSRPQLETVVEDGETVVRILTALGFREMVHFQKRRETWRLGECAVELDTLPYLGCYVEIEGPHERDVRDVQEQLALGHVAHEPESYIALLADHCRRNNLPTVPIRLEDA